nr:hypothetical protein Iba_chr11aCG8450 [Ipomoea batatas]
MAWMNNMRLCLPLSIAVQTKMIELRPEVSSGSLFLESLFAWCVGSMGSTFAMRWKMTCVAMIAKLSFLKTLSQGICALPSNHLQ